MAVQSAMARNIVHRVDDGPSVVGWYLPRLVPAILCDGKREGWQTTGCDGGWG